MGFRSGYLGICWVIILIFFLKRERFHVVHSTDPGVAVPLGSAIYGACLMTDWMKDTPFWNINRQELGVVGHTIGTTRVFVRDLVYPWGDKSESVVVIQPEYLKILAKGVCFCLWLCSLLIH